MEWISVTDRLPMPTEQGQWSDEVLVCWYQPNAYEWPEFTEGWVMAQARIFHKSDGTYLWDAELPVTHWMPLPEPPKHDTQGT